MNSAGTFLLDSKGNKYIRLSRKDGYEYLIDDAVLEKKIVSKIDRLRSLVALLILPDALIAWLLLRKSDMALVWDLSGFALMAVLWALMAVLYSKKRFAILEPLVRHCDKSIPPLESWKHWLQTRAVSSAVYSSRLKCIGIMIVSHLPIIAILSQLGPRLETRLIVLLLGLAIMLASSFAIIYYGLVLYYRSQR